MSEAASNGKRDSDLSLVASSLIGRFNELGVCHLMRSFHVAATKPPEPACQASLRFFGPPRPWRATPSLRPLRLRPPQKTGTSTHGGANSVTLLVSDFQSRTRLNKSSKHSVNSARSGSLSCYITVSVKWLVLHTLYVPVVTVS